MQQAYAESWDHYWVNACSAGYEEKEVSQPALQQFWASLFRRELRHHQPAIILELACGKGAVSEIAQFCIGETQTTSPTHLCLDYSLTAVRSVCQQNGVNAGLVADASKLPFKQESVDLIFSQFGIEYAGEQAIVDSALLLKKQGLFAALLHHRDGQIFTESQRSHDALLQVEQSQIFTLARKAFEAGFARTEQPGTQQTFRNADQALAPAVRQVTGVLQQFGPGIAGGILLHFYRDLGQMFNRMQAYELSDILAWLDRMKQELASYRLRMRSMLDAALNADQVANICRQMKRSGLTLEVCQPVSGKTGLLAWQLQARA